MSEQAQRYIPQDLIIDMDDKSMVLTPELRAAMPAIDTAFGAVDHAYEADPLTYFDRLEASLFSIKHNHGFVDCSLLPGEGSELVVVMAPFADTAPRSGATVINAYTQRDPAISQAEAAPNTWRQLARSAILHETLKGLNRPLPVLTIFNIIPSLSYRPSDHLRMARGDFSPTAPIVDEAVRQAQERLHGLASETQLSEIDFYGASLGASHVIGSAYDMMRWEQRQVLSLTLQERVLAMSGTIALLTRFLGGDAVGGASDLVAGKDYQFEARLEQPKLFADIDRQGNEPAWLWRAIQGALKMRNRGMTHPDSNQSIFQLEELQTAGIRLLMAQGANSGLAGKTPQYMSSDSDVVTVKHVEGGKAAHLINEHALASTTIAALNITQ